MKILDDYVESHYAAREEVGARGWVGLRFLCAFSDCLG